MLVQRQSMSWCVLENYVLCQVLRAFLAHHYHHNIKLTATENPAMKFTLLLNQNQLYKCQIPFKKRPALLNKHLSILSRVLDQTEAVLMQLLKTSSNATVELVQCQVLLAIYVVLYRWNINFNAIKHTAMIATLSARKLLYFQPQKVDVKPWPQKIGKNAFKKNVSNYSAPHSRFSTNFNVTNNIVVSQIYLSL